MGDVWERERSGRGVLGTRRAGLWAKGGKTESAQIPLIADACLFLIEIHVFVGFLIQNVRNLFQSVFAFRPWVRAHPEKLV